MDDLSEKISNKNSNKNTVCSGNRHIQILYDIYSLNFLISADFVFALDKIKENGLVCKYWELYTALLQRNDPVIIRGIISDPVQLC